MWILNWIPDWFFHLVVIGSLLGFIASVFLSHVPLIKTYVLPIKLVSVVLLIVGVWFEGCNYNNNSWLEKVKELEEKVQIAEQKSNKLNTVIKEKVVKEIQVVHDVQVQVHEGIKEVATKIDADCRVDTEALELLNKAAE
jgi:hypothetical protein